MPLYKSQTISFVAGLLLLTSNISPARSGLVARQLWQRENVFAFRVEEKIGFSIWLHQRQNLVFAAIPLAVQLSSPWSATSLGGYSARSMLLWRDTTPFCLEYFFPWPHLFSCSPTVPWKKVMYETTYWSSVIVVVRIFFEIFWSVACSG